MTDLNRLFWRVHFWAGLVTAPIVLFAALTGLLYVFTPQIEASRHAALDHVPVGVRLQSLDAQVAAVEAAFPDQAVRCVVPAHAAGETTQVFLRAAHEGHAHGNAAAKGADHDHGLPRGSIAYVDPYTASVVGQLPEMQRWKTWARKLHSSMLQGDGWRWPVELAASWMLVIFATGLTMWWPRSRGNGGPGWRALLPRLGRGRQTWRDLHAVLALALGAVLAVVLVTGLTWSRYAGDNFRWAQEASGQGAVKSASGLKSAVVEGAQPITWQTAWERARITAQDIALQMTPPRGADGVWRIENFDRAQPRRRFTLVLDGYSGAALFASGWTQMPVLAQATALGIPFHRGEFGAWNQVLLALAALAAIFSVVSGIVMWWQRRPRGRLAAPSLERAHVRRVPVWIWALAAGLSLALPVFGCSLLLFASLEAVRLLRRPTPPVSFN